MTKPPGQRYTQRSRLEAVTRVGARPLDAHSVATIAGTRGFFLAGINYTTLPSEIVCKAAENTITHHNLIEYHKPIWLGMSNNIPTAQTGAGATTPSLTRQNAGAPSGRIGKKATAKFSENDVEKLLRRFQKQGKKDLLDTTSLERIRQARGQAHPGKVMTDAKLLLDAIEYGKKHDLSTYHSPSGVIRHLLTLLDPAKHPQLVLFTPGEGNVDPFPSETESFVNDLAVPFCAPSLK